MIKFGNYTCEIQVEKYMHGGTVIVLVDADDGSTIAVATVNIDGLGPNEVAIKNYSENEGIYDILIDAKVIKPMHREVTQGFVTLPVCILKKKYRCS
jgi:hypothetical protein